MEVKSEWIKTDSIAKTAIVELSDQFLEFVMADCADKEIFR